MEWMTAKKAAELWGVSERQVQLLCDRDKVDGAVKFGSAWAIPITAKKPIDGRTKAARKTTEVKIYRNKIKETNNEYNES